MVRISVNCILNFKVVAIPAKFVIDEKGDIRFKLTGFYRGDDAAVAEVSAMLDLICKGSSNNCSFSFQH